MTSLTSRPARVGLVTDQTGALSFMGIANVNVAKMVTDNINAHGGLLGHPVELYVEDSATGDHVAHMAAARLVHEADVDVVTGGIYSSTRQAIKRAVVDEAAKLYIYPEQSTTPWVHRPVPGCATGSGRVRLRVLVIPNIVALLVGATVIIVALHLRRPARKTPQPREQRVQG